MKKITLISVLVFGLATAISQAATDVSVPIGTAFSYQGRLMEANGPADGLYDFQFKLFDDPNVAFGYQLGSTIEVSELDVNDGYFTVELNFGDNVFNGGELWLEISVRRSISGGTFTVIGPRQQVTPAPYALYAASPSSDGFSDNDWQVIGNDMYAIPSGNVGIGTTMPIVPLDVRSSNPGTNQMVAAFVNPDNSPGTAATIALIVGSGMWPGGWTLTSNYASLDIDPISDMVFPSPVVTINSNRKVGIGIKDPITTLDINGTLRVASSNPGNNVVTAFFTNPSDAADSAVSIDLGIGTAAPSEWRLMAAHDSLNIGNAVVEPPAITISSSHHVGISNGLSVGGGQNVAIRAASGMIPMILITGKNGVVTFGQDYGIYAWGGQKAGCFSGDVYVSGKVGIGTITPWAKLHVKGSGFPNSFLYLDTDAVNQDSGIRFYENGNVKGHLYLKGSDDTIRLFGSNFSGITVTSIGNVGIGTENPGSYKLAVNGSAAKPGGGSWSNFSDIRLKEINRNYERGLSEVVQLNPVRYTYRKSNELDLPADKPFVGFVAQEVQNVIPEAVEENSKGYLMVNNDPIILAMVNAIKQLKVENDQLKQRLDTLEKMVNKQDRPLQDVWQ
ncbi:MAG: tail fiber domain-containing protein [Phycisphaerae bacterium]